MKKNIFLLWSRVDSNKNFEEGCQRMCFGVIRGSHSLPVGSGNAPESYFPTAIKKKTKKKEKRKATSRYHVGLFFVCASCCPKHQNVERFRERASSCGRRRNLRNVWANDRVVRRATLPSQRRDGATSTTARSCLQDSNCHTHGRSVHYISTSTPAKVS